MNVLGEVRSIRKPITYPALMEHIVQQGGTYVAASGAVSELASNSGFMQDPAPDTKCGRTWEVFDRLQSEGGAVLKTAIEITNTMGLNRCNTSSEFPKWKRARGLIPRNSDFYLMDGTLYPYDRKLDVLHNPEIENVFHSSKKHLNGRFLVLLPCTGTAMQGDYFLANTWRTASKWFPERTSSLDFAATDSITTVTKDPLGLIVFENEMNRVAGHDLFPKYSKEKLEQCIEGMERARARLLSYEKIFSFLNVRLYDEAVQAARLPNLVRVPCEYKQGFFLQGFPRLRKVVEGYLPEQK